jgi:polar amino acid transport system substrate-binding protein
MPIEEATTVRRYGLGLKALALAAGGAILASSAVVAQEQSTFERIQEEGVVRVGLSNEAPFAYAVADGSGSITGEAPEILKAVFAEIGVEQIEGGLTEWGSLIPSLVAGRTDVIGAGMYVTPSRCDQVDFGDPEYKMGSGLAVAEGNPLGLTKLPDFVDNPDAKIGFVTGGAEIGYADIAGIPEGQRVSFPDGPTMIAGLQAGQVDAIILTTFSIKDLISKAGEDSGVEFGEMSGQPVDEEGNPIIGYGAMAFRQEDDALRTWYNEQLAALRESGRLLEIMAPFGFTESEMTDVKATDICPNIE